MKTVLLLLLAMLAIKTTSATSAVGQHACQKPYIACMDKCVGRPSATLQNSCMEACQTQNRACFSQVLGAPGPGQTVIQEPAAAQAAANGEPAAEEPRPAKKKRSSR
jgi:hypothetical protein